MFDDYKEWLNGLRTGDAVIYEASHYFKKFPWYYEDVVSEVTSEGVKTEFGLLFINGQCRQNGSCYNLENPEDDYYSGTVGNDCYRKFKHEQPRISAYMDRKSLELNKKLKSVWEDMDRRMPDHVFHSSWKNAMIEDVYRHGDIIEYFSTLSFCNRYTVKGKSLYLDGVIYIKKFSYSVGTYRVFRKRIGKKMSLAKWEKSEVLIYNESSKELRYSDQDSAIYAWYWLEQEVKSKKPGYKIKYDDVHTDFDYMLKRMEEIQ